MSPLGLAWRNLVRGRARAALGVLGVAAVGALLLDMLLLSRGLAVSLADLLASIDHDVRVTSTATLPGLGPEIESSTSLVERLRELPEIDEIVPVCFGSATTRTERHVDVLAIEPGPREPWTLLAGRGLAGSAGERPAIVVNRNLAADLSLSPGSSLVLRIDPLPAVEFEVAGVARFPFDSAEERSAAATFDGYRRLRGERAGARRGVDMLLVTSDPRTGPDAAVAAIRRAHPELYAFSNAEFLARLQRGEFGYFRQIAFALSSITLFFAFVLVTILLTVAVNQRFVEIAALRAIGFARGRIVADLFWESLLLVGGGGLLSLPLGALLATQLDRILRAMPGIPEQVHFFVFDRRAVLLHLALLAATGALAALYPVYLAVRLPIAATLRREVVS